eukprot:Clim_evm72s25 gene=Clim_evmTU72s25
MFSALSKQILTAVGAEHQDTFVVLGAAALTGLVAYYGLKVLGFVWTWYLRPGKDLRKYGGYALVTGATDGIGLAYANEFARMGYNLVLVSRTQSKLDACQKDIESKHGVKVETVAFDFSDTSLDYNKDLGDKVKGLDIGVLVNNVGMSHSYPEYVKDISAEEHERMVRVNVDSAVLTTHVFLPRMIERKKGLILNLSSYSANQPTPFLSTYAASKTFLDFWSRALSVECEGTGVEVQSVLPAFVATKLSKMRPSLLSPKPEVYVRTQLATVGYENRTFGYPLHAIQAWVSDSLPGAQTVLVNQVKALRAKALKRKAEKAAKSK